MATEVAMIYPSSAWERAMKIQEVITRAMSGTISWLQAAEIIGISPRSMRRWRMQYEKRGYDGLLDRRRGTPSPRAAPFDEVQRILRLYREKYQGFNGRHFHEIARREHGVKLSYSFVKKALQMAGFLKKRRSRGRHRLRREPKACLGEMLHLDGSPHAWLTLVPEQKQTLIAVLDDATSGLLHAELFESESVLSVMTALRDVMQTHGLPMSLYTDRAGWAAYTPKAGGPFDPTKLTQVGRALKRLGIEHIRAYSPQARGRGERANRTLQDRLVNELRVEGIRTTKAANGYLKDTFITRYNEAFARAPRDPASAFVPLDGTDLDQILCNEDERTVGKDNTVAFNGLNLQVSKQPGRRSCEGLHVIVRHHLNGSHSIWRGPWCLGRYDEKGRPLEVPEPTRSPIRGGTKGRPRARSRRLGLPTRSIPEKVAYGS
jgi:transposase